MLKWRFLQPLAALALSSWLAQASAAEAPVDNTATVEASKRHYDSGVAFFQAGDYAAARIELEAGYRLSQIPVFLINLCIVAEKQNQLAEAASYCEQYLASHPDPEGTAEAQKRLQQIHQQMATQGAAHGGGTEASRVPKPAIALLAGGGALLVVGIATGAGALATAGEIDGKAIPILYSDLQSIESRGNALNATSIVFSLTGAAAVIAGAGWLGYWLTHKPRSSGVLPVGSASQPALSRY